MHAAEWVRAFNDLVGEQIAATRALAEQLEHEANAVLGHDLSRLDAVTSAKQGCIESLERIEAERRSLVSAFAGNPKPAGLARLLQDSDPSGHAVSLWEELTGLLEGCRQRNLQNGRLVALRRAHVLRSLAVLSGSSTAVTYGPAGITTAAPQQRDLARV
jgi:flagella synthesis protein FlgN